MAAANPNSTSTTSGIVDLNYVVSQVMVMKDNFDEKQRRRLLQLAINGLTEFNIFHLGGIERKWLKVNRTLRTVPLPDDMMKFISVGIPLEGRYWEFTENRSHIMPSGDEELSEERQELQANGLVQYSGFATPGGQNDLQYIYDKKNRRLGLITSMDLEEVLVYYKSTGVQMNGQTYISRNVARALIAYVEYYDVRRDKRTSEVEKERLYREMNGKIFDMRSIENRFTIEQFKDAVRSGLGQTIKR